MRLTVLFAIVPVASAMGTCSQFHLDCGACVSATASSCRYCPADGTCSFNGKTATDIPHRCVNDDEFVVAGESCNATDIYRPAFDGNTQDDKPFFK